jgi:hypothetical protein
MTSIMDCRIDWVNVEHGGAFGIADNFLCAGYPHPQIEKGMRDEHCEESLGCNVEFTTTNYGITTTPKREYEIACDPEKCPEEDKMNKERTKSIRTVKKVAELVELDIAVQAKLELSEVEAIVSVFHF